MKLTLGILQTADVLSDLVDEHGEYPAMFERLLRSANTYSGLELTFITYGVNKGRYPKDIDEVDVYIMTGSKSSVYEQTPWVLELGEFVRTLHQRRKKLIGICFGHQMVAHALGGEAGPAAIGWSLGNKLTQPTSAASGNLVAGKSFRLIYSHQDQVTVPAPGSEILASTDTCPIAATCLGQHVLTFQGHPEFAREYTSALYQYRRSAYPPETYAAAMASLDQSADQTWVARLMIEFCLAPQ